MTAASRRARLGTALLALGALCTTACGDGATAANDAGYIAGKRDSCREAGGSWDAETTTCTAGTSLLFSLDSAGMSVDGDRLTLTGVGSQTLAFSDRPARVADWIATTTFTSFWDPGTPNSFGDDPPNALVAWQNDGRPQNVVVTLTAPTYDAGADTLAFTVAAIPDGNGATLANYDGGVSLFVDTYDFGDAFLAFFDGMSCMYGNYQGCTNYCTVCNCDFNSTSPLTDQCGCDPIDQDYTCG